MNHPSGINEFNWKKRPLKVTSLIPTEGNNVASTDNFVFYYYDVMFYSAEELQEFQEHERAGNFPQK